MKHVYRILILLIIGVVGISIFNIKITDNNYDIDNLLYNSYNLVNNVVEEPIETEEIVEEVKEQAKEEPKEEIKEQPKVVLEEPQETNDVIETFIGNISGYGYDCYGCTSGRTSSGYDITNGNIYYQDSEYGNVRIVAADSKYTFGTIVKISNFMGNDSFYAIVLDRGSAIGLNKKIQFDLVYPTNSDAIPVGIQKNVTFEIVRLGY